MVGSFFVPKTKSRKTELKNDRGMNEFKKTALAFFHANGNRLAVLKPPHNPGAVMMGAITGGIRVSEEDETNGLDQSAHGENGYTLQ